jgi:hypothetical protein
VSVNVCVREAGGADGTDFVSCRQQYGAAPHVQMYPQRSFEATSCVAQRTVSIVATCGIAGAHLAKRTNAARLDKRQCKRDKASARKPLSGRKPVVDMHLRCHTHWLIRAESDLALHVVLRAVVLWRSSDGGHES